MKTPCQFIPRGDWARTTVYMLWVMVEWCFVTSLINLNLITVDVGVRCVHIICTRQGQKHFEELTRYVYRSLEMSNCNDFHHSSCQHLNFSVAEAGGQEMCGSVRNSAKF